MQGRTAGFGQRFRNRFGARTGARQEKSLAICPGYTRNVVQAPEEPVFIHRQGDGTGQFVVGTVADKSGHQHQQVQFHLDRFPGQGVLGLHLNAAVDGLGHFGYAAPDEMDAVVALRIDIKVFVFLPEEAQVHVETIDFRIGEEFFHLDGLFDGRDAADLGALGIAGFHIARTHAVHKADRRRFDGNALIGTRIEPVLQIAVGDDPVVNAVSVFLLFFRLEQLESGSEYNRLTPEVLAVAQHHDIFLLEVIHRGDFGIGVNIDLFQRLIIGLQDLVGGRHVGEQPVPLCHMTAQRGTFLYDDGNQPQRFQLDGRFHSGDASADNQYCFFHTQQHLRTLGRPGLRSSFSSSPRYFLAGS